VSRREEGLARRGNERWGRSGEVVPFMKRSKLGDGGGRRKTNGKGIAAIGKGNINNGKPKEGA